MARIVTFAEYGAPDVLKIEDVALPEPGPDEIRIAVRAIGLNRAESMWRTGKLKAIISKYFRFEQIVEAHRELEKNQHIGRIVVTL